MEAKVFSAHNQLLPCFWVEGFGVFVINVLLLECQRAGDNQVLFLLRWKLIVYSLETIFWLF